MIAASRAVPGGTNQVPVLAGAVAPLVPTYPLSTRITRALRFGRGDRCPARGRPAADHQYVGGEVERRSAALAMDQLSNGRHRLLRPQWVVLPD